MTNKTTIRAFELPLAKRHLNDSSTTGTGLACVSGVFLLDQSTACYSLVGQELEELTPSRIGYAFSEIVVLDHIFDGECFNRDFTILLGERPAEFVQEVITLVGNLEMTFGNLEPGFGTIVAALDSPTHYSLQSFEFALGCSEPTGIIYHFTRGECGEMFQTDINSNLCLIGVFDWLGINFASESSEPLPHLVPFDCHSFDFAFWQPMENDWHTTNLGHLQPLVAEKFESRLRICNALNSAFESGKTLLLTSRVFNPAEEISERLMNSVGHILPDLRMEFEMCASKRLVEIELPERLFSIGVSLDRCFEQGVIDIFTGIKRREQPENMLIARIEPELVHSQFHGPWRTEQVFKSCGGLSSG